MSSRTARNAVLIAALSAVVLGVFSISEARGRRCPTVPDDAICVLIYDPVLCGNSCLYDNQCFASAAGWKPNKCVSARVTIISQD